MVWGRSGAHMTTLGRLAGDRAALEVLKLLPGASGPLQAPVLVPRQEVIFSEPLAAKPQELLMVH